MRRAWLSYVIAAFAGWGCAADADSGSRKRTPTSGGQHHSAAGSGGASAEAGSDGFGNVGTPTMPLSGAGGGMEPVTMPGDGECGAVRQTAQSTLQPADIIIGIDTSGSMDAEIMFVQQNLNAFSQQIIDSGVDVRVILIATEGRTMQQMEPGLFGFLEDDDQENAVCIDPPLGSGMCPGDSNPPLYTHVNREVRSHDMLEVFISAYPSYKDQLREHSRKTFVAITDDDAEDAYASADAFMNAVAMLDPNPNVWANWRFSGIYCFTDCSPIAASVGSVYIDLVAKTGGVAGDLCLQDFAPVFDELAKQVVDDASLACDWEIPPPPNGETFDPVKTNLNLKLDGATEMLSKAADAAGCGSQDGWHYDDEANPKRVVACPATCARIQAARDASIDILFGCETVTLPPE